MYSAGGVSELVAELNPTFVLFCLLECPCGCLNVVVFFITLPTQAGAAVAAAVVAGEGVEGEEQKGDVEVAAVAVAVTAGAAGAAGGVVVVEAEVDGGGRGTKAPQEATTTAPGPHRAGSRPQGRLVAPVQLPTA